MNRWIAWIRMGNGLLVAGLLGGAVVLGTPGFACGQPLTTELPTEWGGDFGNGAATSDAVGGVFAGRQAAAPIPASSYGIPTAFGADWGDVFTAVGYQRLLKPTNTQNDGAVFTGFGIGHAQKTIGVEGTLAIYDVIGDPFQERSVGVKIHRRLGDQFALAVGVENMFIAGRTDGGKSAYGVVSYTATLGGRPMPVHGITATFGMGDGRFNSMDDVRQGTNDLGFFGSFGVSLTPELSLFGTWTGQDLNVGVSVVPFDSFPFVVTPAIVNVTGTALSGRRIGGTVGVGYTVQ